MSDNKPSGIGRWSQRKTASRSRKPGSRGPRITFADDESYGGELEQVLPQEAASPQSPAVMDNPESSPPVSDVGADSESEPDSEDDNPETLDNMTRELDLPPLDSLGVDSDFRPYMQSNVPDLLKQAAMRRLWRIDPAFGFLDGMNDYDEDYQVIDTLISAMDTSYKVGRGYLNDEDNKEDENGEPVEEDLENAQIDESSHQASHQDSEIQTTDADQEADATDEDEGDDLTPDT